MAMSPSFCAAQASQFIPYGQKKALSTECQVNGELYG